MFKKNKTLKKKPKYSWQALVEHNYPDIKSSAFVVFRLSTGTVSGLTCMLCGSSVEIGLFCGEVMVSNPLEVPSFVAELGFKYWKSSASGQGVPVLQCSCRILSAGWL